MKLFFAEVVATLEFSALCEKQNFSAEIAPNGDIKLLDFQTDSAKGSWGWDEKLVLLESFKYFRELKELIAELLEIRGRTLRYAMWKKSSPYMKALNKSSCILNDNKR